jgi:hypothetical protein
MNVKKTDINDPYVVDCFNVFASTNPFGSPHNLSLSSRKNRGKDVFKEVKSCDISLYSFCEEDGPIAYCFFNIKEDHLSLEWIFPSLFKRDWKTAREKSIGFLEVCLCAMEESGKSTIKAKITRASKKGKYLKFIKRFFPISVDVYKDEDGAFENVEIKKENLLKEYENLQS